MLGEDTRAQPQQDEMVNYVVKSTCAPSCIKNERMDAILIQLATDRRTDG